MSNETGRDPDARDERMAALLEVPPLDDVTRRRLVTRAVESTPAETRRSWAPRLPFTAAAAVLAFVVAALGLAFALRDGGGDTTAARDREAGESARRTGDETVTEGAAPATADAGPAVLGDLGAFSDARRLPSLVAAATTRTPGGGAEQSAVGLGFESAPCRAELAAAEPRLGAPTGFGTATYRGRPAIVVVAPGAQGRTVAVAVVVDRCEVLPAQPV